MALSESIAAYTDCYDLFEQAQATEKGIRILLKSEKEAWSLRFRMNQARVLERRESMRLYERSDYRYGKSINDKFRVRMIAAAEGDGTWWVYIEPWTQDALAIEVIE